MRAKYLLLVGGAVLLTGVGYGVQSQTKPDKPLLKIGSGETLSELSALRLRAKETPTKEEAAGAQTLAEGYLAAPLKRADLQDVLRYTMSRYYNDKAHAESAAQAQQVSGEAVVRQNAIIIAQNQRMIDLLEQIAKQTVSGKK
jgi:hypothetical protein